MSKGIFVTATDTGVGKTVVSAAIIRALKLSGVNAGCMKPIETGLVREAGKLVSADGALLRQAAEMDDPIELVTPQRFETPLAPYIASTREGMSVNLESVFNAYERLSRKYEFIVVEGVGGVMVPLLRRTGADSGYYYVIDLIKDLKLDAVVVARPLLGTINHTLLTVSRLLDEGITVAGVIISHTMPPMGSVAEETNIQAVNALCPVSVIAELPYIGEVTIANIDTKLRGCIDARKLME
jgi:dethiobiotin synthetase